MPTQQTTYNSRVTSEALEKKFRDTFTSQGGAELVDDLYASGVVVPVVDFTAAAEGSALRSDLQTAWDFSTGNIQINTTTYQTIVNTPGFWKVDFTLSAFEARSVASSAIIRINDGTSQKPVWSFTNAISTTDAAILVEESFVVFLRSGDSLEGSVQVSNSYMEVWYRQISTVSGDLVNPSGFTFS